MKLKILINFLASTLISFFAMLFLPGLDIRSYGIMLLIAIILGLVNISVKPLIKIGGVIPTFITIFIALFFLNGAVIVLGDWIIEGFSAERFGYVVLFSATLTILNWGVHQLIYRKE